MRVYSTQLTNLLLPLRFEEDDRDRCRQIQAARAVHRDGEKIIWSFLQEGLRQAFGFPAENQKVTRLENDRVIGPLRFCRKKEISCVGFLRCFQFGDRIPNSHIDFFPIIETGALQFAIGDGKTEWFDQMQR